MRQFDIDYAAEWDNGKPHCVRVVEYEDLLVGSMSVIDGDEVVTDSPQIEIVFDYPLSKAVVLPYSNGDRPLTRVEFWCAVYEGYTQIYREEDESEGETDNIPGMLNRQQSEGPHGIWGHHIGDLYIECVREFAPNKFELCMGS